MWAKPDAFTVPVFPSRIVALEAISPLGFPGYDRPAALFQNLMSLPCIPTQSDSELWIVAIFETPLADIGSYVVVFLVEVAFSLVVAVGRVKENGGDAAVVRNRGAENP